MGKRFSQEENAALTVLKRRNYRNNGLISNILVSQGFPKRSADTLSNHILALGIMGDRTKDARRFRVSVEGKTVCQGSLTYCADVLGVSVETLRTSLIKKPKSYGFKEVNLTPCECMNANIGRKKIRTMIDKSKREIWRKASEQGKGWNR